jgi:hypothetical protein
MDACVSVIRFTQTNEVHANQVRLIHRAWPYIPHDLSHPIMVSPDRGAFPQQRSLNFPLIWFESFNEGDARSRKRHTREDAITSSRVSLRNLDKWIGQYCVR